MEKQEQKPIVVRESRRVEISGTDYEKGVRSIASYLDAGFSIIHQRFDSYVDRDLSGEVYRRGDSFYALLEKEDEA